MKRKTGGSEVVFSEATVPAETFAYHKLMGPESSGGVRGVRSRITSNHLVPKVIVKAKLNLRILA